LLLVAVGILNNFKIFIYNLNLDILSFKSPSLSANQSSLITS
jgi:hypothetical protein